MQLYGSYTSPFVRHCRIALAQAGISFDLVETDGAQSARLSPTSKVPFLKGDGISLTDSTSRRPAARVDREPGSGGGSDNG